MIKKSLHKFIMVALSLLAFSMTVSAQYNSEEEMKKAANTFFSEGNYIEALPLFSQLLSTYPKDPNYNYKYGASALFAKNDKEKPLKYLKFAATRASVDPIAYYFLAKAQHLNYNFDAAIVYYNKFKEKGNSKDIQKFDVSRQIEMCENGKTLLKSPVDIGVLDKKEIKESEFFRSYALKGIEGKVTVKPDDFMSKLDRKKKENSLIYIGGTKDKIIFSSYGKSSDSGRDLFSIERSADGGWTEPTTLGLGINTKYDENYPFLHPDGKTLYFCSKGYNSMGGYDIFKSVFNPASGTWSKPENLDFPINTPGDDVMYVSDEDNKLAYFASSRASKQGKMIVYHVTVDSKPDTKSVIKGVFFAEENPSMKSATITIRDVEKDRRYAVYTTHSVTGEYMLVFPTNGGKFKILVETTNEAPVHSAIIEIPPQDEARALKQELILVGTGDDETLVVKNLFDESDEFSITDPLYVENVLKKKANLDVNTTEEEALNSSLQESLVAAENTTASPYVNLSDDELVSQTTTKANELKDQTVKSREQANFAYQEANTKSLAAKELFNEAKNETNETASKAKKQEAAELINEAVALLAVARSLESEASERESDVATITQLQQNITADIEAGNRSDAEQKAIKLDEIADATYQKESTLDTELKIKQDKLVTTEKAYHKDRADVIALTNRKFEIQENINNLKSKKTASKKKKEIADYTTQIEALNIDLEDTDFDLDKVKAKEQLSKKDYLVAKNEVAITQNVIGKVATSNSAVAALDDANKVRIEGDIAYLDEEGVVGNYPGIADENSGGVVVDNSSALETTTSEPFNFVDEKDNYDIINDNGEIIDYNKGYENELTALAVLDNEEEKKAMTVQVNEDWISAIDEEIEIREKQLVATTDAEEKSELEETVVALKATKTQKREAIVAMGGVALADNNEGNATNGNNETENNTAENNGSDNTSENETANTSTNINYATDFTAELEQFSGEDTYESYTKKAAIHTNWVGAIDNELVNKKAALVTADENDKSNIENQIAILENDKLEQEEFAAIYEMQAESMTPTAVVNNDNAVNANAAVSTNYVEDFSNQLEQFEEEDTYETYSKKAQIHTNWMNAIDDEIVVKKEALTTVDENEKSSIENQIAILENDRAEQQEFIDIYEMQAEAVAPTNVAINNTIEENSIADNTASENNNEEENNNAIENEDNTDENNVADNTSENSVNNTGTNSSTNNANITAAVVGVAAANTVNITANNLNGEEDEFSNLKYNNKYTYNSSQSNSVIADVDALKTDAAKMETDANELLLATSGMNSQKEKDAAITHADELNKQSEKKQLEIATIYKNANRNEFYNNESILSELRKSDTKLSEQDEAIAEMTQEESVVFFDQAKASREKSNNASNYTSKEIYLQKAYEQEMKAIERQNTVIAIYTASGDENAMAIADNSNASNENNSTPDNANENTASNSELANNAVNSNTSSNTNVAVTPNVIPTNSSNNATNTENVNSESNNNSSVDDEITTPDNVVYEPLAISLPSADVVARANRLVKEAEVLNASAVQLTDSASTIKKKKERAPLLAEAEEMKAESQRKVKEAEVLYAEAETMKVDEAEVAQELTVNRTDVVEESLSNTEKNTVNNLPAATVNSLINSNDYQDYSEAKKKTRRLVKAAQVEYIKADEAQQEAAEQKTLGISLNAMMSGAGTVAAKEKMAGQLEKLNAMIAENEEQAATLRKSATEKEQAALIQKEKSDLILTNASEEDAANIVAIEKVAVYDAALFSEINNRTDVAVENTTEIETSDNIEAPLNTSNENTVNETADTESNTSESTTENAVAVVQTTDIDVIPTVLSQSIFKIGGNQSNYSSSKPIPSIESLPEGLVFKVQIGAFRNPIPQNHFKGFAPIVKEDAGNGITRYTAGLFKGINMAVEAKNSIRSIGYSDAFVVAFYNGKRISIAEARAKLNGESSNENIANNTSNSSSNNEITTPDNTTEDNNSSQNNNSQSNTAVVDTEEVKDGVSTDVRNIEGPFFAIQVGVYSKPVSSTQLQNISPLNSERTASGLIRYTSGVYKTLAEANVAKGRIRALGIVDAFVVAYNGGQKITIAEANNMLGVTTPVVTEPIEEPVAEEEESFVPTPTIEDVTPEEIVEEEDTPLEVSVPDEDLTTTEDYKIEYKVQLGAYDEDVPVEDAGIFLRLTGRGVKNFEKDGKTIYTIGSFPDYNSALDLQIEMKELGVNNPKVLAFRDGVMISIEEALEIQK